MISSARWINCGLNQSICIMSELTTYLSVSFSPFFRVPKLYRAAHKSRWVTRGPRSPDGAIHHKVHRGASWELSDGALLHWRVDFDLPHVCVSAVLVVGQHRNLDHEGADRLVCPLKNNKNKKIKLLMRILSTAPRLKMKRFHTMPHEDQGWVSSKSAHLIQETMLILFNQEDRVPKSHFPNTSNVQELSKVKLLCILFFKKYEDVFKVKWRHKCLTWFNREMWIQPLGSTISNCCREEEQTEDGEKIVDYHSGDSFRQLWRSVTLISCKLWKLLPTLTEILLGV